MGMQLTYPGIYIKEEPSGERPIAGASTSVAHFVGMAARGPLDEPTEILGFQDFERVFSSAAVITDMQRYVRLFFENGGRRCYVTRIASGAARAAVDLIADDGDATPRVALTLIAKSAGSDGGQLRALVSYRPPQSESEFTLELYREVRSASGAIEVQGEETHNNVSMDPRSPRYVVDALDNDSSLASAVIPTGTRAALIQGYARGGRFIGYNTGPADQSGYRAGWEPLFHGGTGAQPMPALRISVDRGEPVDVTFPLDASTLASDATFRTDLENHIRTRINQALTNGSVIVNIEPDGPVVQGATKGSYLLITSLAPLATPDPLDPAQDTAGSVSVLPHAGSDLSTRLGLTLDAGVIEVSGFSWRRPVPTGVSFDVLEDLNAPWSIETFGSYPQNSITQIVISELPDELGNDTVTLDVDLVVDAANPTRPIANNAGETDGIPIALGRIRDAINAHRADNPGSFRWHAELWGWRLALRRTDNQRNFEVTQLSVLGTNPPANFVDNFTRNVAGYSLGVSGTANAFQSGGVPGADGGPPALADYRHAFEVIDRSVRDMNLLVLPPSSPPQPLDGVWGPASVFCRDRRAMLLIDAPAQWRDQQDAVAGLPTVKPGVALRNAVLYYPRLKVREQGRNVLVGPTGAMAGLISRVDAARGIWKSAAGSDYPLNSVRGLELEFSDRQNGSLNPRAINTLRNFGGRIVSWGSRTMDGDDDAGSEWKYVEVRRMALHIEESLYRGLRWAVFEPNDKPLWGMIRLNVRTFMHQIFRQGGFAGPKAKDAYQVQCDAESTTPADQALGVVNVWVRFKPLRSAEFIVLHIQQKTQSTAN